MNIVNGSENDDRNKLREAMKKIRGVFEENGELKGEICYALLPEIMKIQQFLEEKIAIGKAARGCDEEK